MPHCRRLVGSVSRAGQEPFLCWLGGGRQMLAIELERLRTAV
jgi:hypothetical protein